MYHKAAFCCGVSVTSNQLTVIADQCIEANGRESKN